MTARKNPTHENDNTRRATRWPFQEQFNRGELGISEPENQRHYSDGLRFLRHYTACLEPIADSVPDGITHDWRELFPQIGTTDEAEVITTLGQNDGPLKLSDDMEWVDDGGAVSEVFDNSGFNVFRDLPSAAQSINHKQIVSLAADVLGGSYPVCVALLVSRFNLLELGETEGLVDPASARSCGKGMMRAAMRDLSAFFRALDRAEADAASLKSLWPLLGERRAWSQVGTPTWQSVDAPDMRWRRRDIGPAANFNGLCYVAA